MFASLQRLRGGAADDHTLAKDLKKITDSSLLDIPKELIAIAIEASQSADERRQIMRHLRESLAEPSGKRWRRVYGGLVLAEQLVKLGSPALLAETAEGHHFDLVQRLSFLESFELTTDDRAQKLVRNKASILRAEVVARLRSCEDLAAGGASGNVAKDIDSPRSNTVSVVTCSTAATAISSSSLDLSEHGVPMLATIESEPKGKMILNGVVVVGHNDDSTDESSGDEPCAPVRHRAAPRRVQGVRREHRHAGGTSDPEKDSSLQTVEMTTPLPAVAACTANLLDL